MTERAEKIRQWPECHKCGVWHRPVLHDVLRRQVYGPEYAYRYPGAKARLRAFDKEDK